MCVFHFQVQRNYDEEEQLYTSDADDKRGKMKSEAGESVEAGGSNSDVNAEQVESPARAQSSPMALAKDMEPQSDPAEEANEDGALDDSNLQQEDMEMESD